MLPKSILLLFIVVVCVCIFCIRAKIHGGIGFKIISKSQIEKKVDPIPHDYEIRTIGDTEFMVPVTSLKPFKIYVPVDTPDTPRIQSSVRDLDMPNDDINDMVQCYRLWAFELIRLGLDGYMVGIPRGNPKFTVESITNIRTSYRSSIIHDDIDHTYMIPKKIKDGLTDLLVNDIAIEDIIFLSKYLKKCYSKADNGDGIIVIKGSIVLNLSARIFINAMYDSGDIKNAELLIGLLSNNLKSPDIDVSIKYARFEEGTIGEPKYFLDTINKMVLQMRSDGIIGDISNRIVNRINSKFYDKRESATDEKLNDLGLKLKTESVRTEMKAVVLAKLIYKNLLSIKLEINKPAKIEDLGRGDPVLVDILHHLKNEYNSKFGKGTFEDDGIDDLVGWLNKEHKELLDTLEIILIPIPMRTAKITDNYLVFKEHHYELGRLIDEIPIKDDILDSNVTYSFSKSIPITRNLVRTTSMFQKFEDTIYDWSKDLYSIHKSSLSTVTPLHLARIQCRYNACLVFSPKTLRPKDGDKVVVKKNWKFYVGVYRERTQEVIYNVNNQYNISIGPTRPGNIRTVYIGDIGELDFFTVLRCRPLEAPCNLFDITLDYEPPTTPSPNELQMADEKPLNYIINHMLPMYWDIRGIDSVLMGYPESGYPPFTALSLTRYIETDLVRMVFVDKTYPWNTLKYEKRLERYILYTALDAFFNHSDITRDDIISSLEDAQKFNDILLKDIAIVYPGKIPDINTEFVDKSRDVTKQYKALSGNEIKDRFPPGEKYRETYNKGLQNVSKDHLYENLLEFYNELPSKRKQDADPLVYELVSFCLNVDVLIYRTTQVIERIPETNVTVPQLNVSDTTLKDITPRRFATEHLGRPASPPVPPPASPGLVSAMMLAPPRMPQHEVRRSILMMLDEGHTEDEIRAFHPYSHDIIDEILHP